MQSPLISIIVPVYNTGSLLEPCLSSISKQSYHSIEVILIDDGSTDQSNDICRSFAASDNRFQLYTQENGGRSAARNRGLSLAHGEFIGFVDSDDWIDEDMFEVLYKAHTAYNVDIVQCSYYHHDGEKIRNIAPLQGQILDKKQALEALFRDQEVKGYLWNKLFRAELFLDISFPLRRNYEDMFTVYKLFARSNGLVSLPVAKYHYVVSSTSVSHSVFRVEDTVDYLEGLNSQYQFAQSVGLWKHSSVSLARRYLNALDTCIRHQVDQCHIALISSFLRTNISSAYVFRKAPYLALRRFLFLHVRGLYLLFT